MSSFYSKRHNVGQSVYQTELRVGMLIHLSYTHFACVWKIISVESINSKGETWLNLVAQESKKTKRTNAKYATHIRANQR